MAKLKSRLAMLVGTLGLALAGAAAGAGAGAAPAQADVSLHPACSIRTLDAATAEASCIHQSLLYEYRFTIRCRINLAPGYFWDYTVVSEWRPTTQAIRVSCGISGASIVGASAPEYRLSRPV